MNTTKPVKTNKGKKSQWTYNAPKPALSEVVFRISEPTFERWLGHAVYITESVRNILEAVPKRTSSTNFRDLMFALWCSLFKCSTTCNPFVMKALLIQKGSKEPKAIWLQVLIGHDYSDTNKALTITVMLPHEHVAW